MFAVPAQSRGGTTTHPRPHVWLRRQGNPIQWPSPRRLKRRTDGECRTGDHSHLHQLSGWSSPTFRPAEKSMLSKYRQTREERKTSVLTTDQSSIDFAQYVVTVDLWDETGTREVNLVRSTTATPAISSTIHESFNNLETMPYRAANIAPYPAGHPGQMTLYSQHQSPVNPYAPNQYGQGKWPTGRVTR